MNSSSLVTIVIILIFLFLCVIIIITSCHGFTELGMSMHGFCTCGKVIQTAGTDEAQVVMHSLQIVYHGPLILTFLTAPRAES